jgi:cytoskeleton protein RodZ
MSDFSMTEPSDYAGAQNPADQGQPTPGMQLAMRRHEFNWSVEQVASQLNLAPRQVLAMEADDYGALPGMAVARGFIRSYAKLLKLDSTPMLAQIAKAPGSAEQAIPLRRAIPSTTFQPHRGATRTRQGGPGRLHTTSVTRLPGFCRHRFSNWVRTRLRRRTPRDKRMAR